MIFRVIQVVGIGSIFATGILMVVFDIPLNDAKFQGLVLILLSSLLVNHID